MLVYRGIYLYFIYDIYINTRVNQNIPDWRCKNHKPHHKRAWKLPTSTQLRATWQTVSLDMVVLLSTVAWRYHNWCIDGGTSPEYMDTHSYVGRDRSVIIANCYGLDGPGIKSRCGWDYRHQSRPALGPTQPPVQWVPGLFRSYNILGRRLPPNPSSARLRKE
jgi:hypothetical protein